jgi:hypothetical protein
LSPDDQDYERQAECGGEDQPVPQITGLLVDPIGLCVRCAQNSNDGRAQTRRRRRSGS